MIAALLTIAGIWAAVSIVGAIALGRAIHLADARCPCGMC